MSKETERSHRIWAYVHHQMTAFERTAMEHALATDPECKAELNSVQLLDRELHTLLARDAQTEAPLEDRILSALEEDGIGNSVPLTKSIPGSKWKTTAVGRCHLLRPKAFLWTGGLLAAALLLIVVLPLTMQGPVQWERAQFVPLQYRAHTSGPESGVHSRADAKRCMRELRELVTSRYRQQPHHGPRHRLKASLAFVELGNGQFSITVTLSDRDGTVCKEWSDTYANISAFHAQTDILADAIVDRLVAAGQTTMRK